MKIDILIKNGHVIDPSQNIDRVMDIAVYSNKIVEKFEDANDAKVVDAAGCYVFPGLIDFHTHIFHGGSGICCKPDFMLATGVTSAVDAGSAGCTNYDAYHKSVVEQSQIRIKNYLCVFGGGQIDDNIHENYDPSVYKPKDIARVVDKYRDEILGLKLKVSKNLVSSNKPLKETIKIADELGIGVCVHTTNPVCSMEEIAETLRRGDVICHMYHGSGDMIIDGRGKIKKEIIRAREKGVIFDIANGRGNFSFNVAISASKEKFFPDIISTDWTLDKMNFSPHAKNLTFVMSKFLKLGMTLPEVIKAVTETPAKLMSMEGKIGTLKPKAFADISIFKIIDKKVLHEDFFGEKFESDVLFIPQMTISNGEIVFSQADFALI